MVIELYNVGWIVLFLLTDVILLTTSIGAGFIVVSLVSQWRIPKFQIDVGDVIVLTFSLFVLGMDVYMGYSTVNLVKNYSAHYQTLYATEIQKIETLTGQKVVESNDTGTDSQFPSVRDVYALLINGKREHFYYNPTTDVIMEAKR